MNLVFAVPRVPFPADSGGALRGLELLLALDAAFDVTVLAVDLPGGDAESLRRRLRGRLVLAREAEGVPVQVGREAMAVARGAPLRYARYAGPRFRAAFRHLVAELRPAAVHFDHLHSAQLLPDARQMAPGALVVIDEHNVEARIAATLAEVSRVPLRWLLRRQAAAVRRLESGLVSRADVVLACSDLDARELRELGATRVEVVPNGASLRPVPAAGPRRDVVFVGSMDWRPNADAALVLGREVWPRVRARLPGSRLVLVGRRPPPSVLALAAGDVVVTGTVDDVAPWLAGAWVTAIPLRAGSGTRLKILEAAAAGVPIVCTRLASEGLPFVDGRHCLHAETAEEFAGALERLRSDPGLAARLTEAAAHLARDFEWRHIGERLVASYRGWVAARTEAAPALRRSAGS